MPYFDPVPVAPEWKMKLVRLFGRRYQQRTDDGIIDYYIWRGRIYVDDYVQV